jgi:uncharacterized membrane protein YhiD involved in acid resistance
MPHQRSTSRLVPAAILVGLLLGPGPVLAQQPGGPEQAGPFKQFLEEATHDVHPMHDIYAAIIRLPLAAVLGTALALRPRRRGTPKRDQAVIQTQIVLAVVGAVIMLVVGASLARAFGIVGAANLIRYRSKIEDPKDAVVMLGSLAVGLASGVGLYALTTFSTIFLVALLWVIESFEAESKKHFSLTVKLGADTDALRPRVEEILKQFNLAFELRTSSDEELCYDVQVPLELQTDTVSDAILRLDPEGHAAVEWSDKKNKTK